MTVSKFGTDRRFCAETGWGRMMGVVIDFQVSHAASRTRNAPPADRYGEVVILPVIRIDRYDDEPVRGPASRTASGGKRRSRASRL
jgi:hypothetical protein